MARTIVTPCEHRFRFLEVVRIKHKGRLRSSETLRDRYVCCECSLQELRMPEPVTTTPRRYVTR